MDVRAAHNSWIPIGDVAVRAEDPPVTDPDSQYDGSVEGRFLDHPRVLVVDDDADARAVIASMLEQDGLVALQAPDGQSALRMVAEGTVDAVVLDVLMPGQSGFEICQQLREDSTARHLPVIMVTALSSLHAEISGILSGADAYLVKPVRRKDLMDRIREVL